MLLFLGFEINGELLGIGVATQAHQSLDAPENHVAGVSQIARLYQVGLLVEHEQTAGTRASLLVAVDSINQELPGRHFVNIVSLAIELSNQLAEFLAVNGWVDSTISPAADTIGHTNQSLIVTLCVLAALVPLLVVRAQEDTRIKHIFIKWLFW